MVGDGNRDEESGKSPWRAVAEQNTLTATIKSWPERIKTFYNDVRTEMKKVTTPSLKEVQATTVVVIITVFLFACLFLGGGFDDRARD